MEARRQERREEAFMAAEAESFLVWCREWMTFHAKRKKYTRKAVSCIKQNRSTSIRYRYRYRCFA